MNAISNITIPITGMPYPSLFEATGCSIISAELYVNECLLSRIIKPQLNDDKVTPLEFYKNKYFFRLDKLKAAKVEIKLFLYECDLSKVMLNVHSASAESADSADEVISDDVEVCIGDEYIKRRLVYHPEYCGYLSLE